MICIGLYGSQRGAEQEEGERAAKTEGRTEEGKGEGDWRMSSMCVGVCGTDCTVHVHGASL